MDMSEIFDAETQGDSFDARLAETGVLYEKLAAAEGVDISQLSDEIVAGHLMELMGTAQPKIAEEAPMTIHPAVFSELSKIAAANNIDLSKLSAEDLAQHCVELEAAMQEPGYGKQAEQAEAEVQAAATAEAEKVAAREMGAEMAVGFYAKMSELEEEKNKEEAEREAAKEEEAKKEAAAMGEAAKKLKDAVASKTRGAVNKGLEGYGTHGSKIRAGAALAGAAGAGVAAGRASKTSADEAFETVVLNRAAEMLKASGIDPETGEKVASDDDINVAAIELLRAKGYTV